RGSELPAARTLHDGDRGVRPHHPPGDARDRHDLCAPCASGAVMSLDWSVIWEYRAAFATGVLNTILLTVVTMLISIPGGLLVMLLRNSRLSILRGVATGYVELFRATPLILLIYWTFYVLPVLTGLNLPPMATGLLALSLIVSAYNSETFRAGVNSIRKG